MNGTSCQRHGIASGRPAQPSLRPGSLAGSSRRCLKVAATETLIKKPKLSYVGLQLATKLHTGDGVCTDKALLNDRLTGGSTLAVPPPPIISKPDAEFLALGLEFVETRDGIKITELNELFEKVGFPRRDPDRLRVALDNTHRLIWIRSLKQSRVARLGQLLGFARATSDGVFSATIWDVAVSPAWQRSGLGKGMIERLTQQLVQDGISTITLYAEPQVVGLYKKLGFVDDPEGIRGMAFQRKRKDKKGMGLF
uniref:N-acetyltransferase domain-containing protein n=1 Tax=Tetradesmus obliquus TaxID=3088 RepID=A0A383W9I4_TETOB|eukprot:jgi/Sobl393_1/8882/SZX73356.1